LFQAVEHGHYDLASLLLHHGSYINTQCHQQWTALFVAVREGNKKMVTLLLDHDADINVQNEVIT